MKIKRILAMLVAVFMVASVAACGPAANPSSPASTPDNSTPSTTPDPAPADDGSITLWTYPIGNWGQETEVKKLTDAFTAETGIAVKVEYLAYADGDDKVNAAITGGNAPDLVMEGPSAWSPTGAPTATWWTSRICWTTPTRRRSRNPFWPPAPLLTALSTSIPWL